MEELGRQYRVRIGKNNSTGRELGKPNEATGRALRCQFSCEVGDTQVPTPEKLRCGTWQMRPCACWNKRIA